MLGIIFAKGLAVGLAVAAPAGPMTLLCLRRTLAEGRRAGLVSGFGVAAADGLYGLLAAFGMTAVAASLAAAEDRLAFVAGAVLIWLGMAIFRARPREKAPSTGFMRHAGAFVTTFLLTLANPSTILSFVAIFAGLGLTLEGRGYGPAAALSAGVFAGSALWWVGLTAVAARLRGRLTPDRLVWVNRAAGLVIAGFGVIAILRGLGELG